MRYLIPLLVFFLGCNEESRDKKPEPSPNDTVVIATDVTNPASMPDVSPMDMIYYPIDFPKLKMTGSITDEPGIRIIYSRPKKSGRKIFGELLQYGKPWRLGANESTEIQFFKPFTIQDKKIEAGRYIMYCIPSSDKWTLVLNSNVDSWGLQQDMSKDIARFEIPVSRNNSAIEYFTMAFEAAEKGFYLVMAWDDVIARLPISE